MESSAFVALAVVVFAFLAIVSSEPFIEAQDVSLEWTSQETSVKRTHWCSRRCYYANHCPRGYYCRNYCCWSSSQRACSHHAHCPQGWYCDYRWRICRVGQRRCSHNYHCSRDQICVNGFCRKRQCYYHSQCTQGHQCVNGICKPVAGYCTSHSSCTASQCCSKQYSHQASGLCRNLKKPGDWCPMKPDGYHCGCVAGYECRRYYNHYYWGKCYLKPCSSDSSCQKTHCCSGRQCKPRKKEGEYCPLRGADIYHCACIEGYECKPANVGNYWGKCEEESGSGFGEKIVS